MGLKVLIVDDEKAPRDLLENFLPWKDLGFDDVRTAEDGESALQAVEALVPDVIISDIKMPRLSGIDLARQVRRSWPDCKFVFLSGYPDKEHLKDAIKLKAASFVEKPIDLAEVESLLRDLAAECALRPSQDPRLLFFRGKSGGAPLNGLVCTVEKSEFSQLGERARAKDREAALRLLGDLLERLKRHEGTDPEYIRNVFCRIVLLFSDAAETHNAPAILERRENLLYKTARAGTLLELEQALRALACDYFDAVCAELPSLVDRVDHYLELHFAEPGLTVQQVADALGFVNTYLCMAYKKACGKTVNQQLTALRIRKAQKLLLGTSSKLYQVAAAVGYGDPQYFTRVFAKEVGVSPRQYREEHSYER